MYILIDYKCPLMYSNLASLNIAKQDKISSIEHRLNMLPFNWPQTVNEITWGVHWNTFDVVRTWQNYLGLVMLWSVKRYRKYRTNLSNRKLTRLTFLEYFVSLKQYPIIYCFFKMCGIRIIREIRNLL